jgi:KTSC domain-containing protein
MPVIKAKFLTNSYNLSAKKKRGDMERQQVSSSNIRSIGYDATNETLEVEFHSGGVYQYLNVPEPVYSELMSASSKGSYLNSQIKTRYQFRKVG